MKGRNKPMYRVPRDLPTSLSKSSPQVRSNTGFKVHSVLHSSEAEGGVEKCILSGCSWSLGQSCCANPSLFCTFSIDAVPLPTLGTESCKGELPKEQGTRGEWARK